MKTFYVARPEVHIQWLSVKAKNKEQALKKVMEAEGEYVGELVYQTTLDHQEDREWYVTENKKEVG